MPDEITGTPEGATSPDTNVAPESATTPTTEGQPTPQQPTPPAGATPQPAEANVPSWRLREQTDKYKTLETQHQTLQQQYQQVQAQQQQLQAQYELDQRRMRALAGLEQQPNQQEQQLRQELLKHLPEYQQMLQQSGQYGQTIQQMQQQLQGMQQAQQQYQQESQVRYGADMGRQLEHIAEQALGSKPSQGFTMALKSSLVGTLQSNPRAMQAFMQDGPRFLNEYWQYFNESVLSPQQAAAAQQQAQQAAGTRAAAPAGPQQTNDPSAPGTTQPPKVDRGQKMDSAFDRLREENRHLNLD